MLVQFKELCLCVSFSFHFKLDKSLHNALCRLNVSLCVLSLQEFATFLKLEVQITFPRNLIMKI